MKSPSRWGLVPIEKKDIHIYTTPLPDGYYLVLVQRRPSLAVRARATMADAAQQLIRERGSSFARVQASGLLRVLLEECRPRMLMDLHSGTIGAGKGPDAAKA